MKNITDIAKEQGIDVISLTNIDDVILDTKEKLIKVSKRHMAMIVAYFMASFKDYYPKEYVMNIAETGIINSLFGVKFILEE